MNIQVIHKATGAITEGDANLAVASQAIIIGFNVRPDPAARRAAEQQGIDIRFYNIIYQLTDDIKKAMVGMLAPTFKEVVEGFADVRKIFRLPSRGKPISIIDVSGVPSDITSVSSAPRDCRSPITPGACSAARAIRRPATRSTSPSSAPPAPASRASSTR